MAELSPTQAHGGIACYGRTTDGRVKAPSVGGRLLPNRGLQILLLGSTICREICVRGPKCTLILDEWLPFRPLEQIAPIKRPTAE